MTIETGLSVRDELLRLADSLSEDATWDDVLARVLLWRKIDRGLRDIAEGRFFTQEEVEHELGLCDCE